MDHKETSKHSTMGPRNFKRRSDIDKTNTGTLSDEAELRIAIEATGLGIFDYYPLSGEMHWSHTTKEHFGLSPDAHVNYNVFLVGLHPEDRARVDRLVHTALQRENDGKYSTEYRTIGIEDGKERWIAARGQAFFNQRGEAVRFIGTTLDTTERKRAEEELRRIVEELEHSNKELQQFAYVASHDIQEPLRTVASYVDLLALKYKGKLDEKADRYIDYAVEGANRISTLINDLLAFSRVGTQGKPFSPVEMSRVFTHVIGSLKRAIKESGATVTTGDLPAVTGDDTQLVQLLQNLVGNAIKFRKKDVPPRIHISCERTGNEWVFGVHDNGIGIEPRFYERIFGIFQRLHSREEYAGTGVGLAICKRIVERHSGRIWVDSKPGEESSFYFTLPARG